MKSYSDSDSDQEILKPSILDPGQNEKILEYVQNIKSCFSLMETYTVVRLKAATVSVLVLILAALMRNIPVLLLAASIGCISMINCMSAALEIDSIYKTFLGLMKAKYRDFNEAEYPRPLFWPDSVKVEG